jgi:dTDP-4-dehydrorhamnose reductase
MPSKILIIGKNGQLSSAFAEILGDKAEFIGLPEIDLAKPHELKNHLEKFSPKILINAAAYTAVDKAEEDYETARLVNSQSPGIMAEFCKARDIPFIHYSTDYVFPGTGEKPWRETDSPAPLNAYGRSKLEGEKNIERVGGKYMIFRTSWVYDDKRKNFLTTMLRLGAEREKISVVADQWGAPTYAPHLAKYSLKQNSPSGIYHMANSGVTNWYEFAREIFRLAAKKNIPLKVKEVEPISSSEYKLPANRPHNSRLDMEKIKTELGIVMPDWREALKECIDRI